MRSSRAASHASIASTVSEVDESANDRVLLYPKGYITISLDIPRSKCMFVVVKVKCSALVSCHQSLLPRAHIGNTIANGCIHKMILQEWNLILSNSLMSLFQTRVLNEVLELGRTDSRETIGDESVTFDRVIEITYYSGECTRQSAWDMMKLWRILLGIFDSERCGMTRYTPPGVE